MLGGARDIGIEVEFGVLILEDFLDAIEELFADLFLLNEEIGFP